MAEYHQINTEHHSIEEAARNWDAEINKKSRTDQDSLTIPVHASGMVPFGEFDSFYLFERNHHQFVSFISRM